MIFTKAKSNLQMLLFMKRIDQKSVAYVLGVDASTICRWLKNPTVEQQKKIMVAIQKIEGGVHNDEND